MDRELFVKTMSSLKDRFDRWYEWSEKIKDIFDYNAAVKCEQYITKRNEYDMIKAIEKKLPPEMCVIEVISGEYPDPNHGLCWYGGWDEKCDDCIQKWLNEESE